MILRAFSHSTRLYRLLGNEFGARLRVRNGMPKYYPSRAKRFLERCERHQAIRDGSRLLEIGTGWMHWESMVLRSFYDVETTLFDVWDNRQLEALKRFFGQFEDSICEVMGIDETQRQRIHHLTQVIVQAKSFDDLYKSLGFQYVIDKNGSLEQFQDESFDLIYSVNVLEHIDRSAAPQLLRDYHRVLKSGGFSVHSIDISDHLVSFSRSKHMPRKNYLRYSDEKWKRTFENKVQYINRIQRQDWLDLFRESGLELVEEETKTCDVDLTKVSKTYEHLTKRDLECKSLTVVHRKAR